MSSEHPTLEERLIAVEKELAELRQWRVASRLKVLPWENWVEAISGSMKDFPEFDKVLEYGREFRRQQLTP